MTEHIDTSTTAPQHFLRELTLDRVDLVPAGANPGAHIELFKASTTEDLLRDDTSPLLKEHQMEPTSTAAAPEMVNKADLDAAHTELEDLRKQLDEAKAAETEATELRKQLDTTRETVEKMQRDQREAEFIAKAAEFENLGPVSDIGKLMMAADEHFDDAQKQTLTRLLSGASAQVEKGALFQTFTRPADKTETLGWQARLNKAAQELVAAGTVDTIEKAQVAVMESDSALRAEYQRDMRGE